MTICYVFPELTKEQQGILCHQVLVNLHCVSLWDCSSWSPSLCCVKHFQVKDTCYVTVAAGPLLSR